VQQAESRKRRKAILNFKITLHEIIESLHLVAFDSTVRNANFDYLAAKFMIREATDLLK